MKFIVTDLGGYTTAKGEWWQTTTVRAPSERKEYARLADVPEPFQTSFREMITIKQRVRNSGCIFLQIEDM